MKKYYISFVIILLTILFDKLYAQIDSQNYSNYSFTNLHPTFVVGVQPFVFVGGFIPGWHFSSEFCTDEINEELIKSAKENGINVLHLMLPGIEKQLGVFEEQEILKLDRFINCASKYGVYVIPEIIHGVDIAVQQDHPYYHPHGIEGLIKSNTLKQALKNRIDFLINHRNLINGVKYSEDPTILAWIMITEPVSAPFNYPNGPPNISLEQLKEWSEEICSYIKSIDKNHLVTIFSTAAIDAWGQNWDSVFNLQSMDFLYLEDADMRILNHFGESGSNDYPFRLFKTDKTIVMGLSYTSGAWYNSKICDSLDLQAKMLSDAMKGYNNIEATGFIVQKWGSYLYQGAPAFDRCYSYNSRIDTICHVFQNTAKMVNSLNWPNSPLPFVKIKSTSTDISMKNQIVNVFSLYQNYPNPFNPNTTIKYSVPRQSFVTIKIYDVLGRKVATIISEEKSRGNYSVDFNAAYLSSDIYFYEMKTDGFIQAKKMILLR